ncbi:MAG: hypothetical protein GXX79_04600 [Actinomycetales bacterium]|nr:hypothetical protein [Actinomycetales bacterium]
MKRLVAALGVVAVALTASVAVASPTSAIVELIPADSTALTVSGPGGTVSLTCFPTGGTHPRAAAACADLVRAYGQIRFVPPLEDMGCLAYWDPVEVTVVGRFLNRAVSYRSVESNPGCARISRGNIFFY